MFRLLAIRSLIFPFLRLVWRLLLDKRVPVFTKIIPLLALIYLVSPYDIVADFIPILGQFDDLIVVGLLLFLFVAASPAHVVADLTIGKKIRDLQNQQGQKRGDPGVKTVDAKIRYIDEDPDENPDDENVEPGNRRN
jgi:uncharacterized membrane protein YkvA (DUF1232 family)